MPKKILTKEQIAVLEKLGGNPFLSKQFYFTGGTPLAAFYLGHRYSEDLDFFSEQEFDPLAINIFFQEAKKELGIRKIDFQQSYIRNLFFLHLKNGVLKTEFTYFPFPRIAKGDKKYGLIIDSLIDIAVNKLFTIYQRTKARDYIDLYFITRKEKYTISELIKKAKIKFDWHIDPIQLGAQFTKALEALDEPRMIKKIAPKEWQEFFLKEAKKLTSEIFEK